MPRILKFPAREKVSHELQNIVFRAIRPIDHKASNNGVKIVCSQADMRTNAVMKADCDWISIVACFEKPFGNEHGHFQIDFTEILKHLTDWNIGFLSALKNEQRKPTPVVRIVGKYGQEIVSIDIFLEPVNLEEIAL